MKAVKLSEFKIPARRIAEAMWGTGGTTAYKTTRKGAYYYSCSGHGGYVVDNNSLTEGEKNNINQYISAYELPILVQTRKEEEFVIGVSTSDFGSCRKRSFRYHPSLGPVQWINYNIYLFEEDCNWAILEKFTDIRTKEGMTPVEEIEKTFNNWIKKITKKEVEC